MKISETRIDKPISFDTKKWLAIFIAFIINGGLILWSIYGMNDYGIALFILVPLLVGMLPTIILGYKNEISLKTARLIGFQTLGLLALSLIIFAIEGLICIAMVAPIALFLTWIGSNIGYALINKSPKKAQTFTLIFIAIIPLVAFVERSNEPSLTSVITSIEIKAEPETVWKNVIEFPTLDKPTEFIFRTGIAYPINADIIGKGVGAVRHCNFTTGKFVEPITIWDEPRLLKFDVVEQPAPMKELSFWDIDAPHLHDFFVSKSGQFKLTSLPNGHTLLEGTTWYYHNIKPDFYWQLWSNYIIHKIHNRVLIHIKKVSEQRKNNK